MKKGKKIFLTIISVIVLILLILSTLFIIYDLYLFTGILKFYRVTVSLLILFITFILGQWTVYFLKNKKITKYIILLIISLIYSILLVFAGYYIYRIISNLEFNNDKTTYSVSLITFNEKYKTLDKLDSLKIGIIEDTTDITNYVLPMEFIEKNKLDDYNTITKYSSTLDLLTALYNEEVDAIFINSEYESLYSKLEEYKDIKSKAILIKAYKKDIRDIDINLTDIENSGKTLTEPFTILLLGVDSEKDGLNPNAAFNGDTMMMITFNPNNLNATMFSIPRDTYVPISCSGNRLNKINTAAYGGSSCVVKTLENLTGIKIDYYAMINFKGVVNLVDQLGGITVNVPKPDYEDAYCLENSDRVSGGVCLSEGLQELDGEHALALARVRYAFSIGDFQRGQNQQLVVEGMLNKVKDIRSINKVIKILDIINKNISTNLSKEQILSLYEVGKKMIVGENTNLFNIQKTFLTGYDMSVYEPASGGNRYAFFHYKQSLNSIVTAMKENLGLIEVTPIKTFSFSINEIYEKEIIGYNYYGESRYPVVPNFYSISDAINWANSKGLPIKILNSNTGESIIGDYDKYDITSQNEMPNTLVVRINSVTIYAAPKNSAVVTDPKPKEDDNSSTSSSSSETSSNTEEDEPSIDLDKEED